VKKKGRGREKRRTHITALKTLAQADVAGTLLATIAIRLVGKAAKGRRLADKPLASK
jgi:hypothetical protein